MVLGNQDRLNEQTYVVDIAPESLGQFHLSVAIARHHNRHVDIAVAVGIALGIGAIHQHSRLLLEVPGNDVLVLPDEI